MKYGWRLWMGVLLATMITLGIGTSTSLYRSACSFIAYPALRANAIVIEPITNWFAHKRNQDDLLQQLLTLQEKYLDLERTHEQLQAKLSYFNNIKELRAFGQRYKNAGPIVRILARSFGPDEQFMLIDAGSKQNVSQDTIVLHKGTVVGKVSEVYPWYSKVCLITDAKCKVGAYCAKSRVQGIHEGCNEHAHTHLRYVDHLSNIQENDLVCTSGEGLLFPEGFTLGRVSSVAPDGLYKRVTVAPACDLGHIQYCMLMAKSDTADTTENELQQAV